MKRFNFKYSLMVWLLLSVVVLFSIGGLVWNAYALVEYWSINILKSVSSIVLILLCLLLAVLSLSIMIYGKYVIKGKNLYACFGLVKTKYEIEEIVEITHFKKSNKLVAYFNDQKYTVIVIAPIDYEEFILGVRKINPKIVYDTRIDGEDTPE